MYNLFSTWDTSQMKEVVQDFHPPAVIAYVHDLGYSKRVMLVARGLYKKPRYKSVRSVHI